MTIEANNQMPKQTTPQIRLLRFLVSPDVLFKRILLHTFFHNPLPR